VRLVKQSARSRPRVSLILVDWSVRESFHLLHYLARQNVERDSFEVIVVEYYSRVSEAVRKFESQVDTWLVLDMPETCYYHKHLMYNAGIFFSRGEICVICDSDAMVREGFVRAILDEFDRTPEIVLHLDQFRNSRRDLYPFSYPTFEDVTGRGCVNNAGGQTKGIQCKEDTIHNRNYGACMCARREDLIAIGGADEHLDYLGHICGPYDMTFRLVNLGRREKWHQTEYLYHTWHPGQAGEDNYLGPHDGRHVSTTALDALSSGRVLPLIENENILALRLPAAGGFVVSPRYAADWSRASLSPDPLRKDVGSAAEIWRGFVIERRGEAYVGYPVIARQPAFSALRNSLEVQAPALHELKERLIGSMRAPMRLALPWLIAVSYVLEAIGLAVFLVRTRWRRVVVAAQT